MKRRQLKSLRISFVVLSFLLYFKATTATLTHAGVELRQQSQPQSFQQASAGRQHDNARRSQPFNALLTSVGQLADSPLRRHGEHLALTASRASGRKRLARAVDDGGEAGGPQSRMHFGGGSGGDGEVDMAGMDFGDMFQSVIQFILNAIGSIMNLFAPNAGDG
ncbi:uncharacterized protein LOC105208792 [Zeugodacus cucurbitae]|uniref:Uncharacterized RING finger protein P8B7.23 n=1 Tax=Zeugodacus cucurbitae TaxID=28588 RepID=A0A0A1X6T2_ZEUCU|nr:uncharacterized protein LOC105208792 [Zeugodacus cucurbitae]